MIETDFEQIAVIIKTGFVFDRSGFNNQIHFLIHQIFFGYGIRGIFGLFEMIIKIIVFIR